MKSTVRFSAKAMFQRADMREPLHLVFAECCCPVGAAPSSCKHVGAMCYGVEEFCQTGVFKGITSCTSQLQHWNAPPSCRRLEEMSFVRLEFGKVKHGSARADYDCRPANMRNLDGKSEAKKFQRIVEAQPKLASSCFRCLLSSPPEPQLSLPTHSTVSTARTDARSVKAIACDLRTSARQDASTDVLTQQLVDALLLSPQQQHAVEYRTLGQSENALWIEHRWGRLTASRFGNIVRRVKPAGPLVTSLLYESLPRSVPALTALLVHSPTMLCFYP